MNARRIAIWLALLALVPVAAQARTEKQDIELGLGGALRTSQDAGSPTKDQQNTVAASLGYFVTDNLELGYGLFIQKSKTLDQSDKPISVSSLVIHNFFLDYYVYVNRDDTAAVYFGPSLGVASLRLDTADLRADGRGATAALHVGFKYFVSEDTTLYSNLEFRGSGFSLKVDNAQGEFETKGARAESTLFFGMTYFFGSGAKP